MVSMITLNGRIKLSRRAGEYQKSRSGRMRGQADLVYRNGTFYLIAVVDEPEKSEFDPAGVLGVDLGMENIAADSDGQLFRGEKVEQTRKRYQTQSESSKKGYALCEAASQKDVWQGEALQA